MEKIPYILYLRNMVGDANVLLNAACVVLTNDQDEILLQERTDSLRWGLPGGLMELDESIQDCAIREVFEETGLEVELVRFIGIFNNPMQRWRERDEARILVFAFTGKVIGGELSVHDHESKSLCYFRKDELPSLHSIDTVEIINAYYERKFHQIEGRVFE